jgi:hypothetical protein
LLFRFAQQSPFARRRKRRLLFLAHPACGQIRFSKKKRTADMQKVIRQHPSSVGRK